ncbi:hypothetical protein NDU88_001398 [Pleurodeles waltl]|uniref:Uncharacterized protein n=1 Tax=Pleurodeles waltl TaxID=8319 RepID=A0AAV7RAQ6_PLEWA|nr:hypothetical protein NDU88_001398 [Pleurodeles waltl]
MAPEGAVRKESAPRSCEQLRPHERSIYSPVSRARIIRKGSAVNRTITEGERPAHPPTRQKIHEHLSGATPSAGPVQPAGTAARAGARLESEPSNASGAREGGCLWPSEEAQGTSSFSIEMGPSCSSPPPTDLNGASSGRVSCCSEKF